MQVSSGETDKYRPKNTKYILTITVVKQRGITIIQKPLSFRQIFTTAYFSATSEIKQDLKNCPKFCLSKIFRL